MSTFLETVMLQRMTRIALNPFDKAREISANEFRPKDDNYGIIQRKSEPEFANND